MDGGLAALGLSGVEETAYLLLLDVPRATLARLRLVWDRPEPLELVLEGLRAKGLVEQSGSVLVAAPPVALESLVLEQERRLAAAREYAARLAEQHRAAGRPPRSLIEVVTGRQAVLQRLGQLNGSARRELRCLSQGPPAAEVRLLDLERVPAAVSCRTIHDRAFLVSPLAPGPGRLSRTLPDLPMSTLLVDDAAAVLPLRSDPAAEIEAVVVVRPCALLDVLSELFENLWQRAIPLDVRARPGTYAGDERMIALLLSGLTDAAIARRLGVGHRTVQRRIAALLDELGVNSRFQAGVQVAFREQGQA
ncbi:hypothetical protein [Flindersiella endophytica]